MSINYISPNSIKKSKFDENSINVFKRKNFLNGLHNALNILDGLERSLQKTSKYEKELLRCKSSHSHTHSFDEWGQNEQTDEKDTLFSHIGASITIYVPFQGNQKPSRNLVDLTESWSTMSIVCMQYQYEELSKRYECLLQAYDERCRAVSERDKTIMHLQNRLEAIHEQLVRAHKTLLSVGEKYLMLRRKRLIQKQLYEEILEMVKRIVQEETPEELPTESAPNDNSSESKCEVDTALLMSEIRNCNTLFLENLYLKTQIDQETTRTTNFGNF